MKLTPLGRFLEGLHQRAKLLSRIMLAIMACLVIADIFIPSGYDRFWWESVSGAGAVYGLFACVVIVVVSKFLGYKFLYRPENYFDDQRKGNELIGDPKTRGQDHD
jgi:membrane protein implicated in regulation of membrane protease activity